MTETLEKEKKKKIYKVATELNISHETLIEFLRKKGYDVKGHNSTVSDEMMRDILSHFKKDKDVAERHHRKIQEIRETKKKAEKKVEPRPEAGVAIPHPSGPTAMAPDIHPPSVQKKEHAKAAPLEQSAEVAPIVAKATEPPPVFERELAAKPEVVAEQEPEVSIPTVLEPPEVSVTPTEVNPVAKAGEPYLSPLEKERRAPKPGLTIKGKIDLTRKKAAAPTAETGEMKKEVPSVAATEELHKRKKKKKKVRDEIPAKAVEADELERKKKKTKKSRQADIDQNEVKDAIRRTFAAMEDVPAAARAQLRKRKRREREEEELRLQEEAKKEAGRLRVTEFVSVNELANLMGVNVAEVIKKCMELGIMVSINQRLDKDTITLVADEFGFETTFYDEIAEQDILSDVEDRLDDLVRRPPVVTIMGHVDHGKTSLLDYIRQSNVVAGEAGGITQHIGAYEVTTSAGNKITFLDTPGHEAFTAMRARGAQVTDIVVLVVAADDSVMPQTLEAISHAQAASVPIIIAINKTDKPDANPDRIRQQLAEKNVLVEEWGGKYQSVEISARTGKNVDLLLEKIALEADVLDLKGNPNRPARGTIIEAQLDRGKGITATVLVQKGKLRIGDPFLAGIYSGKIRAMFDERGNRVEAAGPSTPAQITGLDGIPQAGDSFIVMVSESEAREISLRRQQLKREQDFRQVRLMTLDDISQQIQEGKVKELAVIVKGDVDGSVEALSDSLMKLQHKEVKLRVIHSGVGMISESDVMLAAASGAVIIGFRVRPNLNARRLAERERVDVRNYNIIYDAINDIHKALEGLLAPATKEEVVGTVEVREVFKIPKVGNIAGAYVQDGKVMRNNKVRLIRDGIQVFEGSISSLKRFKDDVREVESGFEFGIGLEGYNDIKVGDIIEAFRVVETKRKLSE
jgi:translation initiation factor IF-2